MAVTRVVLPYAPRLAFMPYHDRVQRWAVLVAHRRAGKTVACVNDLVRAAVLEAKPDGRYAYIGPYYNQSKDIAWTYLKRYAAPLLAVAPNETELRVELLNGARIRIYGADNPDRLRGLYLDGVVLDEYADMHPAVWGEVIRPALSDRRGWATFIGTPKGRNSFFELFERARQSPDAWFACMLRASETGLLAAEELTDARRDMTPEQYEQEFECSFDAAILGAYYAREIAEAERAGRICEVPHNPDLVTHTAWDLGHHDSTCIWFFQMSGRDIHVIDYYETHNHALSHYASVLAAKSYRYGSDFVPHDAKVAELGTGKTRVETLRELGRKPRLVPMHKVEDGINAVRVTFNRLWFDELKCRAGLEALRQYRVDYDDKKRAFKSTPRHDWTSHAADAARYLVMAARDELQGPKPKLDAPKVLRVGRGNTVTFNDILDDRELRF